MRESWKIVGQPFDPAGAGPPIPGDPDYCGLRTMTPNLRSSSHDRPAPSTGAPSNLKAFFRTRRDQSLRIRRILQANRRELQRIVGGENVLLSFAAREGISTDSTGHRGLISEALFIPPDLPSLQALMAWCFQHRIPMIPYGAGSGYNMGVVPLAPAVTIWPGCLNHIDRPRPSLGASGRVTHVISAGAGATYTDLVEMADRHGLAVRCLPNSPRASVGGIVATGSNGGRRIGEIVVGGQAVMADGSTVRFAASPQERAHWAYSPFPLVHKFHDAPQADRLRRMIRDGEALPASLFVGAEGTTGIITAVELEVEERPAYGCAAGLWVSSLDQVPSLVQSVRDSGLRPTYFELLTQPAIDRYLRADYPDLFDGDEQAYVMIAFEDDNQEGLLESFQLLRAELPRESRLKIVGPYPSMSPPPEAQRLMAPREALPRRLISKCKSDVEALVDALPRVIPYLAASHTADGTPVESILFGHLRTGSSAILHWNIGGVDLALEESAERAWRHLESTLVHVSRSEDGSQVQAVFTGEHGASGKPWLFRDAIARDEMARLLRVKRGLDPRGLINPAKLFLPTRVSKAIRARMLRYDPQVVPDPIRDIVARCTRCNACQNCPVIDAQISLRTRRKPRSRGTVIAGKRGLVHAVELLGSARLDESDRARLKDEAALSLDACISCGRCDAACPGSISMDEIAALLPSVNPPPAIPFLHRIFLAPTPRSATMLAVSVGQRILRPTVRLMHKDFTTRALSSYAALPPMGWRRYATHHHRLPGMTPDLRIIGDERALVYEGTVAVRFKGCVGNVGQAQASVHEDRFFASMGMAFLDFVPDLCCGFPFLASGDRSSARTSRERLWERIHAAARSVCEVLNAEEVVVMTSCPTCQGSLRRAHQEQGAPPHLCVADPAQYAMERAKIIHRPTTRRVGLKVPCHATPEATTSQEALLREHGFIPVLLPQCCGMAGTGRLQHPEVGLVLAERLAAAIRDAGVDMVVSGCPSCRDGMQLQATIDRAPLRVDDIYGLLVEAS